jgi:hypothetical protein
VLRLIQNCQDPTWPNTSGDLKDIPDAQIVEPLVGSVGLLGGSSPGKQ